jgi:hypothetical protein
MSVDALATVVFRGVASANLADPSGAFGTLRTPWFSRGAHGAKRSARRDSPELRPIGNSFDHASGETGLEVANEAR